MPLLQENEGYAYADYCMWDESERWELIRGIPRAMAPGPTESHQSISFEMAGQLRNFLRGKPCKAFTAPFDVRLNADGDDNTVVQPDLLVVCDASKLDGKCCTGAPDLIVEILSPSTARHDRLTKLNLYQHAGVREYWIVDPETKTVQVCMLDDSGSYVLFVYGDTGSAPVRVLPGCEINLQDVFEG